MSDTVTSTYQRPTTLSEIFERLARFDQAANLHYALTFQPKPTDVIIASYRKSGTTWLQQILHGLRTRGSMAFDEITEVIPFLEIALLMGVTLDVPQVAEPRIFKSHLSWYSIPKGGRYIVSIRDPKDVFISYYHFWEGAYFEPGAISLTEFVHGLLRWQGRKYWEHLISWWEHRHDANVLILSFEEMKRDLSHAVRKIARFVGYEADEALLKLVIQQASLEFMLAHKAQFNDLLVGQSLNRVCGFPPLGYHTGKVRTGRVGDHVNELSEEINAELDAIWDEEIRARYGIASYQALCEQLTSETWRK